MEIWPALVLGLAGSLHCAGMCGPLVLAVPVLGQGTSRFTSRALYHGGRIATYIALGVVSGLLGQTLSVAGLQNWLSLIAGAAIVAGLAASSSRFASGTPALKAVRTLKSAFGKILSQKTQRSLLLLGALNGLLPCGLVYVACAGAAATGSIAQGSLFMALFGLGTTPMLVGVTLAAARLQRTLPFRWSRIAPISALLLALLLMLRGLALGIPWLSPSVSHGQVTCPACASTYKNDEINQHKND